MIKIISHLVFTCVLSVFSTFIYGQSPVFQWVKLDSVTDGVINSVAYSANGDFIYMGGSISGSGSTAFPVIVSGSAGKNGLVAKYSSTGNLVWAFSVGGNGSDEVTAITVDANDNVIIAGNFDSGSSTNFSGVSGGSTSLGSTGAKDVFIAKYSSAGILMWVQQGTSAGNDFINDLAVDTSGNIYAAGTSFDNFSYGGTTLTQSGSGDAFAMKTNNLGVLSWLKPINTNGLDELLGVTVFDGFAYFGGYFSGSSTIYLLGIIPITLSSSGGAPEMMVAKMNVSNGDLTDFKSYTGTGSDKINSIANDGSNLYFTGTTTGTLTIGSYSESRSKIELITAKIDKNLNGLWANATTQTGVGSAVGNDVAVLPSGKVIVSGTYSGSLNTGLSPNQSSGGSSDGIILMYNGSTKAVENQSVVSGAGLNTANSISIKNNNEMFLGGSIKNDATFSPLGVFSANNTTSHPFVAKYGCTPGTATLSGASTVCSSQSTTITVTFTGPSPYSGTVTDGVDNYVFTGITASSYTFNYTPTATSTSARTLSITGFTSGSCGTNSSNTINITVYPPITNNTIASNVTICSGQVPSFTGNLPAGGDGSTPTYVWQYNIIPSIWPSGTNTNNLQNYTSLAISNTTKYRRAVSINGCPTHYSNEITATVIPVIANNTISSSENLCNGTSPQVITGSTPTGGTGTYTYSWLYSTDNLTFYNVAPPVNAINYTPPASSTTYYYKRKVNSGACLNDSSNSVNKYIYPNISNNSITASQTICLGTAGATLSGSSPAGGDDSTYTYSWQMSPDNSVWGAAPGTNNAINYTPQTQTANRYYRRIVVYSPCPTTSSTSNTVLIDIHPPISSNTITANQTICANFAPTALAGNSPTGGGGTTNTYLWQSSTDNISFLAANGTNTGQNYSPLVLSATTYYRRKVSRGTCTDSYSDTVTISVQPIIGSNSISANDSLCQGVSPQLIVGSAPTGGNGSSYAYTWMYSADNITYAQVSPSVNAIDYLPSGSSVTYFYKRIVGSTLCANDTSNAVQKYYYPGITNNSITSDQTICVNTIPAILSGSTPIGGNSGTIYYQWQESTDDITFISATGGGSNNLINYQPGSLIDTKYYRRRVIRGPCDTSYSVSVKVTVDQPINSNAIIAPTNICSNDNSAIVTGSMPGGGGSSSIIYSWQSSSNGSSWLNISGANGQSYSVGLINSSIYFRRIVSSGAVCAADTSNSVNISVSPAITTNSISANQTICNDSVPNLLIGAVQTPGTFAFEWQESTDNLNYINAAGVNSNASYQAGNLTQTTYYKRIIKSGACPNDTSGAVTITVYPILSNNDIEDDTTVCFGSNMISIVGSSASGGGGSIFYNWETSFDGVTFSTAPGTSTGINYTTGVLTQDLYLRRKVSSVDCSNAVHISDTVLITVQAQLSNNTIYSNQILCGNYLPDTLTGNVVTGGSGTPNYQWQWSLDQTTWNNAVNTQNYGPPAITDTTYYRRKVSSGVCVIEDISNTITAIFQTPIGNNVIAANDTICYNSSPNLFTSIATSGGDSTYSYSWEQATSGTWSLAQGVPTSSSFQANPLTLSTKYRRIVTSSVCPEDTSNLLIVIVLDTITNNIIHNDTAVCYGGSLQLTGDSVLGGSSNFTYLWEESANGSSFVTPASNFTSINYTTSVLTQSTYYRRRVVDTLCNSDTSYSNIILVTVHSQITHNYSVLADTVCDGADANVVFQISGDSPFTISYTLGGLASQISNINSPGYNLTFTPQTDGLIILDTLWDVNGCSITPADTFSYRVVPYSAVYLGADTAVCDRIVFSPTYGIGNIVFSSPTLGTLSNTFPQNYLASVFGTHQFILTETLENCMSSDTISVTFEEPIGYISAGEDQQLIIQDSTYLNATSLLANQTGYWTLVSGVGTIRDSLDPFSVFADLISGVVVLEWTVEQNLCASKTDQMIIGVGNLLIPTGFSPNNDGTNDFLEIAGRENIDVVKIQVFDRWGGLVFEDNDYQSDWAGTAKSGKDLPEDTYFVIVDVGFKGIHKGYIIIRR
jgi:gliding motility-associated-like protein